RDESVYRLEPGRHRLVHGAARDDAGRLDIDAAALACLDRPPALERIAERIDHPPEQALSHPHVDDRARAPDGLAFLDLAIGAEDHDADVVGFEIERHATHAILELDHLAGLYVVETVDAGDTVANREHLADFGDFGLLAEIFYLLLENRRDFGGANFHQAIPFIAYLIALSLVRSELSTMREPSLTMSPPMIAGSIFTSTLTSFLVTAPSGSLIAASCESLGRSASVTSAVTSPLWLASSAR